MAPQVPTLPRCTAEGCSALALQVCSECGERRCHRHLSPISQRAGVALRHVWVCSACFERCLFANDDAEAASPRPN